MLGFGRSRTAIDVRLPVMVQVVQDKSAFALAERLWKENTRAVRLDPGTAKEFLRFGLVQAGQAVWFERDQNRPDCFELILTWKENDTRVADIYVVTPGSGHSSGNADYL